jgi:hypothetical protein
MPRRRRRTGVVPDRPALEAEMLAGLVRRGIDSADRLRELISISETDVEQLLKTLHPNSVRHFVRYRAQVRHHFDRLLDDELFVPRPQRRNVRSWPEMSGATNVSTTDKSCVVRMTLPAKREKGPR